MEPETTLWIAVLTQAVKDAGMLLKKVQEDPTLWANPLFRSEVLHLRRYFRSRSMEPGGFGFICNLMGVDPGQAAKSIENQYFQHLIPVEKRTTCQAKLSAA